MSAVGSDAAFMLEKALEEMDDMFRDTETKPIPPSPRRRPGQGEPAMEKLFKVLEEFEHCLNERSHASEKKIQYEDCIYHEASMLPKVKHFCEDFNKYLVSLIQTTRSEGLAGTSKATTD